MAIETYVDRARRLKLDPTKICIACGSADVAKQLLSGHKFCDHHVDWEQAAEIKCSACGHRIGLVCSAGI